MPVTLEGTTVDVSLSAMVVAFESIVTASTVVGSSDALSALVVPSAAIVVSLSSAPWPFPGLTDVKTFVPLSTRTIVDVSRLSTTAVTVPSATSLVPVTSPVTVSTVAAPIVVPSTTIPVAADSTVSVAASATIVAVVPGGKTIVVPSARIAVAVPAAAI